MELEEHINKLKIAMAAFITLEGIGKDQALSLAQSAHREWALDQRTELIAKLRGHTAVADEQEKPSWRDEPATAKQLTILKRANTPHLENITKGEASDLIETIMARR